MVISLSTQPAEAQFIKKIVKRTENKIKDEANRRLDRKIDKKIDQGFDTLEKETTFPKKKKKSKKSHNTKHKSSNRNKVNGVNTIDETSTNNQQTEQNNAKLVWSKFDFVPGDEVIFEDGPSPLEDNGEFPSRWDLYRGNAEIANFNDETVIYLKEGGL